MKSRSNIRNDKIWGFCGEFLNFFDVGNGGFFSLVGDGKFSEIVERREMLNVPFF